MLQPCRLFVCLLTIILLPAHVAAQQASSWIVGVRGGAVWLNDLDLSDNTGTLQSLGAEIEMDTGFGIAGAIGREWRWPANSAADTRAEFEVSYRRNGSDAVTVPGFLPIKLDGDLETWTGMANVYFDIRTTTSVRPYIGAGIGWSYFTDGDNDGNAFAFQGMAGLRYHINSGTSLIAEYRFMAIPDAEMEIGNTGVDVSADYVSHNAFMGVAFNF